MQSTLAGKSRSVVALLFFWLSACAMQLAPAYDSNIVSGLQGASEAALTHYAAVNAGVDKASYPTFSADYNAVIGKLDMIRALSTARYMPAGPTRGLFRRFDLDANVQASTAYEAPSTAAIAKMVETLTKLQSKHRESGLTPIFVAASKNEFEISLDQALTYEKALER